jgi:hypothetical protein
LKKNTCANYKKSFQKYLLLFLLSANLLSAVDRFAFFSNNAIATSFAQTPVCSVIFVLNYSINNTSFLDGLDVCTQNLFFGFEGNTCTLSLPEKIKNNGNTVCSLDETPVNLI